MTAPNVMHTPRNVTFDPEIMARTRAFWARQEGGAYSTPTDAPVNPEAGVYGIVRPLGGAGIYDASQVTNAVVGHLANDATFDRHNPEHSVEDAMQNGNDALDAHSPGVAATFGRFYRPSLRRRRMDFVYGISGEGPIFRESRRGFLGRSVHIEEITPEITIHNRALEGNGTNIRDTVQTGNVKVRGRDRRFIMTSQAVGRDPRAVLSMNEMAGGEDSQALADRLVEAGAMPGDRVVHVIDIIRQRRRLAPWLGIAAATGAAAGAAASVTNGETVSHHNRPGWRERWQERRRERRESRAATAAGAATVGAAVGATAAGMAARRRGRGLRGWYHDWEDHSRNYYRNGPDGTRIYRQDLDRGYRPRHIWNRLRFDAEALALGGLWAASRNQRRARTLEYYRDRPDYAGLEDDEIWLRERRRRSGNIILGAAAVVGAIATVALLQKNGHFDLNWSNRSEMWNNDPIVPHINMSHDSVLPDWEPSFMDGDGLSGPSWWPKFMHWAFGTPPIPKHVEFIPGHLPGQHVTPITVPNNVDPDKWMHNYLVHHPEANGPGAVPRPSWDFPSRTQNPNAGGSTGGAGAGAGGSTGGANPPSGTGGNVPGTGGETAVNPTGNGQEIYVEPNSGIIRETEQYRASIGRPISEARADQLYLEARRDFGNDGLINGIKTVIHPNGTPEGDLWLSRPGNAYLTNQYQQLLDQAA